MPEPRDVALSNIILSRAATEAIGGRFTDLELLSLTGFTSIVFRCRDARLRRPAVLKFLKPWADAYRTACFKREAEAAGALVGRENIVQLVGGRETMQVELVEPVTGFTIPIPCEYFALERARQTLTALLFGHLRPRSLARRVEALRDVVKGVNRLHNAGYCHRDLKPDNVLLFGRGVAKLGDLGTCRLRSGVDALLTNYSMPPGDCTYAAPETFNGGGNVPALYHASDWFSVGAILFEAVTGQNLYVAIGLKGPDEIVGALAVGRTLSEYQLRVAQISGQYPVPSTTEFASEPWFRRTSGRTHNHLSGLVRDLCHFDPRRRLLDFSTILRRLDLILASAAYDALPQSVRRLGGGAT